MAELEGKVALVTGAGGPIGRATALSLADAGASVAIVDVNEALLSETLDMVASRGVVRSWVLDISKRDDVGSTIDEIGSHFGHLDIAFNNAGVEGPIAPIDEYDVASWLRIVDVNLTGTFLCLQREVALMRRSGGGSIINNASILGVIGRPGVSGYTATKHAIVGLTKSAALDYADGGIRINAILPGFVSPGMIDRIVEAHPERHASIDAAQPIGRTGTPGEIAQLVTWLASDSASLVIGAAIPIDGGFLAR